MESFPSVQPLAPFLPPGVESELYAEASLILNREVTVGVLTLRAGLLQLTDLSAPSLLSHYTALRVCLQS